LAIGHNVATALLHAEPIDLKAFVDELMPALVPEKSVKLLTIYIGPVKDLLFSVPEGTFPAQVPIVRYHPDRRVFAGIFCG
jgi:hypothetical protein